MGLMTGHAYSIIKVVLSTGGKQLVQVRNPWGNFEWNGAYSDKAPMCRGAEHTATHCKTLQHTHCNTLQHTATHHTRRVFRQGTYVSRR